MPPNPSVPDIPDDWAEQEAQGTPYVLGVVAGETAWRPMIRGEPITDQNGEIVTAQNGRPVFVD